MKIYVKSSRIVANTSFNPRKGEYYEYLNDHIGGVKESWRRFLKPSLIEYGYDPYTIEEAEKNIQEHDSSKFSDEEFDAYCNYFYPSPKDGFSKDSKAFDQAWLHHIHNNPHHWQHWVLIRDEGAIEPQDMDNSYICEMLCDWHSFSSKDPDSTAYNWYKKNKSKMKLSDKTRKEVEILVEFLQDPLMEISVEED